MIGIHQHQRHPGQLHIPPEGKPVVSCRLNAYHYLLCSNLRLVHFNPALKRFVTRYIIVEVKNLLAIFQPPPVENPSIVALAPNVYAYD